MKFNLSIDTDDLNNILDELPEIIMQIQFNQLSGGNKTKWKITQK